MIKKDNSFRHIKRVSYGDAIIKQYIGEHNILRDINKAKIKEEIMELQQIRVSRRPVDKVAENPAIPDEFYFGTTNENGEWRSERMPKIELLHPIGLRAYEPETYYVVKNGRYVKEDDPNGVWQPNTTYYLKGRYRPTQYPVGKVAYKSNYFFFRQIDQSTGEEFFIKDTNGEWIEGQRYYEQYKTSKGKIAYREI
jgi:hypothetical protein